MKKENRITENENLWIDEMGIGYLKTKGLPCLHKFPRVLGIYVPFLDPVSHIPNIFICNIPDCCKISEFENLLSLFEKEQVEMKVLDVNYIVLPALRKV